MRTFLFSVPQKPCQKAFSAESIFSRERKSQTDCLSSQKSKSIAAHNIGIGSVWRCRRKSIPNIHLLIKFFTIKNRRKSVSAFSLLWDLIIGTLSASMSRWDQKTEGTVHNPVEQNFRNILCSSKSCWKYLRCIFDAFATTYSYFKPVQT